MILAAAPEGSQPRLRSCWLPGSTIYAVDLDQKALAEIPDLYDGVEIRKVLGDLQSPGLRLPSVDGILMANSLHFIWEQRLFLRGFDLDGSFPDC